MKKESIFIIYMTVAGVLAGFLVVAILMAIAIPSYNNYLLTIAEKQQYDIMDGAMEWIFILTKGWVMVPLSLIIGVIAIILFLRITNPNISMDIFKNKKGTFKLIIAFALAFILMPMATLFIKELFGIRSGALRIISGGQHTSAVSIIYDLLVTYSMQFGVIWLLIGESGWLGDLSSWKWNGRGGRENLFKTFSLGSIVGFSMAISLLIQNWFFNKYFILVSEVLDRSGETSFVGFKYIMVEFILLAGIFCFIFACLTVALAPVNRDMRYRKKYLVPPLAVLFIMTMVMVSYYGYASAKYDLNKKNLAEAVGIPDKTSESRTMIIMNGGYDRQTPVILEWPLRVRAWGMFDHGEVEVSSENLEKIEIYLTEYSHGSVFQYSAKDALYKGYNTLGEMEKGLAWQYGISTDMLLPRLQLIKRLSYLPVTEKNIEYLKSFTDEDRWYISGTYSMRLAEAFIHVNQLDEASRWLQKAKDQNVDIKKIKEVTIPDGPVITIGKISGTVKLNRKVPKDMKIVLFYDRGYSLVEEKKRDKVGQYEREKILNAMVMRMVGVSEIDGNGRFTFDKLGKGEYTLVLITDKDTIPYDRPDTVNIENVPEVIKLDKKKSIADLGMINITIK